MKNYKLLNNVFGWVIFLISAVVYCLTIESSASFWDCSEFITSAFKLEVGHPPGAPFFMLMANLFTQFTSDLSKVGMMVNIFSAMCSAGTILFLFWTITHLTKKVAVKEGEEPSFAQGIAILGSGLVGALAYTFSDTFWFSAVEGEVYACSSLFTAVVFWLILKWENHSDEAHADRWIVLIAYLMGLSIGVHLLNLLCIPAIVMVYYYKKFQPTNKGAITALLISFALVAFLMYGLIPGMVRVAGWWELLFVNGLSMPFNTGVFAYSILLIGLVLWGIYETAKGENRVRIIVSFFLSVVMLGIPFVGSGLALGIVLCLALAAALFYIKELNIRLLNFTLVSLMVMAIGYSSFAIILIRSAANTPMDQNSPEDVFTLERYLNREQYGDRPLFYGQTFVSDAVSAEDGGPIYTKKLKKNPADKDEYYVSGYKQIYKYNSALNMLLPRMYSSDPTHIEEYKRWSDFKGKPVNITVNGETKTVMKPTMVENVKFFLRYQVGFMYFRYFMWNFSGRQNDIQGNGEIEHGNAITGFNFIDKQFVGDQSNLPPDLAQNKGRNAFYLMPLILGLLGLLFQVYGGKKGEQGFIVTFLLFFMTGLAIVIYLNQYPMQPRERDYAYAGSFYAYCIWIGMGVYAIYNYLKKYAPENVTSILTSLVCLIVPVQMASQTWDDHDRSGRTVCPDFGQNYLQSCEPNAIIFTNGDNDTFPLWYMQEVEGVRRDVRVCNLSYLQTDWYIDQMKREAYESQPLPISWTQDKYVQGNRDIVYLMEMVKDPIDLKTAMDFVKSDDPRYKRIPGYSVELDFMPSKSLFLNVDSATVMKNKVVKPEEAGEIVKRMDMNYKDKRILYKDEVMILEMLLSNNWERPIYYAISVGPSKFLNLKPYMRQTGLAYQIVPIKGGSNNVDTDKMYENLMTKFKFGGVDKEGVYLDENVMNMARSLRGAYVTLAEALLAKGDTVRAKKVLDYSAERIPHMNVPYDFRAISMGEAYYKAGDKAKAEELLAKVMDNTTKTIEWYFSALSQRQFASSQNSIEFHFAVFREVLRVYNIYAPENIEKYQSFFEKTYQRLK